MLTSLFLSVVCLTCSIGSAFAETVTFYGIKPTTTRTEVPTGEISISMIGVGSDGMTTYLEEIKESEALSIDGSTTATVTFPVVTLDATIVMDASKVLYTQIPTSTSDDLHVLPLAEECDFDGKGSAVCVDKVWVPGGTATFTTTNSGPTIPVYTLTVDSGSGHSSSAIRARWCAGGIVFSTFLVVFFGLVL